MRPADPVSSPTSAASSPPSACSTARSIAWAAPRDASIYRLIPEAVVRPRDLGEVRSSSPMPAPRRHLTFRTAGTSLSGQAVSDDLLVELAPHWKRARVLDAGRRIWSQPGVIGGHLNRMLAPHAPASAPIPPRSTPR